MSRTLSGLRKPREAPYAGGGKPGSRTGSEEEVGGVGVLLRGMVGEMGGDCSGGVGGEGVGVGEAQERHDIPPPHGVTRRAQRALASRGDTTGDLKSVHVGLLAALGHRSRRCATYTAFQRLLATLAQFHAPLRCAATLQRRGIVLGHGEAQQRRGAARLWMGEKGRRGIVCRKQALLGGEGGVSVGALRSAGIPERPRGKVQAQLVSLAAGLHGAAAVLPPQQVADQEGAGARHPEGAPQIRRKCGAPHTS
ncbi:hypothetical protein E2C01_030593 [Portunus trituberculatus]|uniref:Uncharacterized protein n=1 Tax=Portunus trituberculatus TaxID=210409 RepID=A0A5B7EVN8_PORTR|nr:hypothetical protein [Portunus trituberculatus]